MKKTLLFLCLIVLVFIQPLHALNPGTHKAINERIAQGTFNGFSLDAYLKSTLGISQGIDETVAENTKIIDWLKLGGEYEDWPPWTIPYRRSVNHFHNPITKQGYSGFWGTGIMSGISSTQWALLSQNTQSPGGYYSWYDVRSYYLKALTSTDKTTRDINFADTFRGLGQLMHLVQDASVPAHTRDDGHLFPNYETWVADPKNVNISTMGSTTFTGIISTIASFIDTNQYNGGNPSASNTIGLAEYANANFVSEGLIAANFQNFPYPDITQTTVTERTAPSGNYPRQYYLKNCCGETNNGQGYLLSAVDYLDYYRQQYPSLSTGLPKIPVLDDNVYQDYAKLLLPRAVGYSAGLLNYFFRGDIDMIPDDATGSGYVIVNNIDEDMNGTFELWYDNTNDERRMVWNSYLNVGSKSSGSNKSTNITFTPPTDAKEPGRYMLVFNGKLGNEDNAVVGKEIKGNNYLFLISAFDQSTAVFEIKAVDNQYQLIPAKEISIPIKWHDPYSHNLTVQPNQSNTAYSFSYPGSFWKGAGLDSCTYQNKILNYGLRQPSRECYYGSSYVSRPPTGFMTAGDKDGDYSIYAFGRHNYTLDTEGKMITYNDSIWRDNITENYIYRYKTNQLGNFINGDVVALTSTKSEKIIAALGDGKAIKIEAEMLDDGFKNEERYEKREAYSYTYEKCFLDYYSGWRIYTYDIEGEIVVNYAKIQNKKDTTHDILMVSDNIIDIVESNYNYTAEGAYYGTTSNMANFDFSWSEASDPCRSRGVTSSSPNEITLTYQSESNNQIGAINVLNYDNFNGDTTWMILYEKDESLIYSTLNATETYRVIYGEPPGWITGPHLVGDPLCRV